MCFMIGKGRLDSRLKISLNVAGLLLKIDNSILNNKYNIHSHIFVICSRSFTVIN